MESVVSVLNGRECGKAQTGRKIHKIPGEVNSERFLQRRDRRRKMMFRVGAESCAQQAGHRAMKRGRVEREAGIEKAIRRVVPRGHVFECSECIK